VTNEVTPGEKGILLVAFIIIIIIATSGSLDVRD
jgi:hypothetical protein